MSKRSMALSMATLLAFTAATHATTIFDDDLESHDIGDQVTALTPDAGQWSSTVSLTPSAWTVQANPLGSGQVLRGVRPATGGNIGYPTLSTLTAPQPGTTTTLTWDTYRPDAGSGFGLQSLYMGSSFFVDTTILPNQNTQFIRYNPGTGLVTTGVKTGFGGWERWEVVFTWSAESGGKTYPTFDLFFERLDANNNLGVLARTQLADDVAAYPAGFDVGVGNMRTVLGVNSNFNSALDSTVYFDNFSVTVVTVPEPASLGVFGMGALLFVGGGRGRGCVA